MRPLRFITLLILAPVLGLATTLGAALALAAWMPMQTQSRHQSYAFIADQRPWSAVERCDRNTWLI